MGYKNRVKHKRGSGADNFRTPPEAMVPLLPYLDPFKMIWEPCFHYEGAIGPACRAWGYSVYESGLSHVIPIDFLLDEPPDMVRYYRNGFTVVTNPPYSLKDEFIERCFDLGEPWALLLPLTALEGKKRQALYKKHGIGILLLNRRIQFATPTGKAGKDSHPQFATFWLTHRILPAPLMYGHVPGHEEAVLMLEEKESR